MLTNKKISVLIILLSLLFSSCGPTSNENNNKVINNSVTGKKEKSIGGETIDQKDSTKSVSDSGLKFNK